MEKHGYISEIKSETGINVNRCYQCGKCSAGCAVVDEMDYPPSMVMRMLQTNDDENYNRLLKSESIWLCVSCENCVTRCPMEIDIPGLMDYMRQKSLAENKVNKKSKDILSFHKSFLNSIKNTGRLFELGLIAEYKARSLNLLQDVNIAPKMIMKGKLHFLPDMVKNRKQVDALFKEANKKKESK